MDPTAAPVAPGPDRRRVPGPALPLPAARAAVFAAAGTVLGAAGHDVSTDTDPSAGPVVLAAALLFAAALPAARRQRSCPFWLAWTLAGQALLHWLLTPVAVPGPAHAHHLSGGAHPAAFGPAAAAPGHHGGSVMVAAHLAVTVLVAVLVHRADRAWWSLPGMLARAVRRIAVRVVGPPGPPGLPSPKRVRLRPGPPRRPTARQVLVHSVVRRGPPAVRTVG